MPPDANYCRQCGASVVTQTRTSSSELPTAVFGQSVQDSTTQRLDPRPTSPERGFAFPATPYANNRALEVPAERASRRWMLVAGVVLFVIIIGTLFSRSFVKFRTHNPATITATSALIYPGSHTTADLKSGEGRVIQLESQDSVDKVVDWYETNLKPTKIMRLTATTAVLKNQDVTATVTGDGSKTHILIKQLVSP